MNAGNRLKRLLPPVIAIMIAIGVSQAISANRELLSLSQILIFTLIGIGWVAYWDHKKPNNMQGCMTILAFGFVPILAFMIAGLEWVSARPMLDPAIGWAGTFRLPAFLFIVAAVFALVTVGMQKLRREKRKRFIHFVEIAFSTLALGIFASLIGFAWLAIAYGLERVGL